MNILIETAVNDIADDLKECAPATRAHIFDVCIAYSKDPNKAKADVWRHLAELINRVCNANNLEMDDE